MGLPDWRSPGRALLAVSLIAGAGLIAHKVYGRHAWSHYVELVTNRRHVVISPSNSQIVVERFEEIVWGEDADKRDGPYTQYWINGELWYSGQYARGVKVGVWSRFDPSGHKVEERTYDDAGKEIGIRFFERQAPPRQAVAQAEPAALSTDIPPSVAASLERIGKKPEKREPGPDAVRNFGLVDHRGRFHELHYYTDKPAVVLFVHQVGCPIVRHQVRAFEAIAREAAGQARFFFLNSSLQDGRADLAADADALGLTLPILHDGAQLVGKDLGLTRSAEVIVLRTRDWAVAYRGPLDDRVDYEAQKPSATRAYLADALAAVAADTPYSAPGRPELRGCVINFPEPGPVPDYASQIAPMLAKECVSCHTEDGVAPWPMEDYEDILGWSKMIREVVVTRRMPPWFVDADYSSPEAARVELPGAAADALVRWIDAGSPRGEGEDPLPGLQPEVKPGWPLGEPDHVFITPKTEVPATGILDWTYVDVPNPFDGDRWVRAVHIRPKNLSVLHHGAVLLDYPKHLDHLQPHYEQAITGYFAMYLPGKDPEVYPEGTGVYLPEGARLRFQLHYTTTGVETSDQTELAVYFWKEPPPNELKMISAYDYEMKIPPHAQAHEAIGEYTFEKPVALHGTFPHMHFRGRAMSFEAHYPSGEKEMVQSIPYFRYDWQRYYPFEPAKRLPAGTKIVVRGLFDNSPLNPLNPDPEQVVRFGGQSWDEMFVGWIYYVEEDGALSLAPAR